MEENSNYEIQKLDANFIILKDETVDKFGDRAGKKLILDAKKHTFEVTKHMKDIQNRKTNYLKNEEPETFSVSNGSRKINITNFCPAKGCNCSNEAEPIPFVR